MDTLLTNLGTGLFATAFGTAVIVFLYKGTGIFDFEKKKKEAVDLVEKGKEEAGVLLEESKKRAQTYRENIDESIKKREERIEKNESMLASKEQSVKKKEERLQELRQKITNQAAEVKTLKDEVSARETEAMSSLLAKLKTTKEQLKEEVIQQYKNETPEFFVDEESMKEELTKKARAIVVSCLQRLTSPTSVESRAVHIIVPRDLIKGKIVGKDACNIKALEERIDVAIVFNDLPQVISVSAFNLVERRVAQRTIEKLIAVRGDISTPVIEKCLKDARFEVDEELYGIGKVAAETMGFKNWDKDLLRIVGRLQYRTSYGQNIMRHSMEVSWMSAMLASEAGLNAQTAKVAGFLHDIGKAIDQDPNVEDAHDRLTKEIMEKYKFPWEEVHAAWVHHDAEPQQTAEAFIIKAADAVSAARPGARAESTYGYAERLEALEAAARSFDGVDKIFAMSGGREMRLIVDPKVVDDQRLTELARQVADKIEEDVVYPGHIKVNLVRRQEYVENANPKK